MGKRAKEERGRYTAKRKVEAVMRLLKGDDLDTVSRELGVTAATLSAWRDAFLAGAEANLKSREPTPADDDNLRLKAKIGELTMENELLREKATKLEVNAPHFPWSVATDARVIQFHRGHRDPEIQSAPCGRYSAPTVSARYAQGHCARG